MGANQEGVVDELIPGGADKAQPSQLAGRKQAEYLHPDLGREALHLRSTIHQNKNNKPKQNKFGAPHRKVARIVNLR